ncbi:MAG TPA: hypothetical protein VMA13_05160 [Candidatus Saccharimonadales bacterium]|nr:hypothetical protein [Candidatus Saccharimonadales bacterium]
MSAKEKPPDFDEEFTQAVAQWREQHKLREDDATLLLIELFRIHQKHWDALRRREMPSFNQFRSDIGLLTQATKTFQQDSATLIGLLKNQPSSNRMVKVTRAAAIFAALACLMAGYLIGRAWP